MIDNAFVHTLESETAEVVITVANGARSVNSRGDDHAGSSTATDARRCSPVFTSARFSVGTFMLAEPEFENWIHYRANAIGT